MKTIILNETKALNQLKLRRIGIGYSRDKQTLAKRKCLTTLIEMATEKLNVKRVQLGMGEL